MKSLDRRNHFDHLIFCASPIAIDGIPVISLVPQSNINDVFVTLDPDIGVIYADRVLMVIFNRDPAHLILCRSLAECEKISMYPLRYYYIKYREYRPGSYGKMSNSDAKKRPYMFSVMQTKLQWSQNTYIPFLKAASDSHLSRDNMGQRLIFGNEHIICTNGSYIRRKNADDSIVEVISIT